MNAGNNQAGRNWPYPRQKPFVQSLRRAAAHWFAKRGFKVHPKMPYCLDDHENWRSNIILPEVAEFIQREQSEREGVDAFPLHKYLHHGLSSQAMLFNLIGPLLIRSDFEPLKSAFQTAGIVWPQNVATVRLEDEDRAVFNESYGQPTSIDFAVYGGEGEHPLFVESKLVETKFGGCSVFSDGDCDGHNPIHDLSSCYLHHIGRLYWKRMAEHGFLDSPLAEDHICPFTNYYQFFRETMFAVAKSGLFVLLHDERNPVFIRKGRSGQPTRGLWPFLMGLVPDNLKSRLHAVTIQGVVQAIEASGRHQDWVTEFKEKYAMT